MCGIAGIAGKDVGQDPQMGPVLECMLGLMRHRGPDDRGRHRWDQLWLGHLRLSILDLSQRGHQPMFIADGRYAISYNGEVYNYLELRRELEADGVRFHSDTDTEVILQAYRRWGLECFERFNGMWALALWDRERRRLVLSRDRVGIKPLYWCLDHSRLAFASEIKSLAAFRLLTGGELNLNPAAVQTYLNQGLVDGLEETFFQGILRFKPGHFMLVEDGRIRAYQPYWDLPARAADRREELAGREEGELAEELSQLMADAVAIHTRADVPVGVCLSGGLDSSAVAGLASRVIPGIKTFTSWYPDQDEEYNELAHAQRVCRAFDLPSHRTEVEGRRLLEKLPELLWYLDEPTLAMGVYPQWHVMQAAAQEVTVVMDGQGGDEIFAGYDFYAAHLLYGRLLAKDFKGYQQALAGFYRNYGLKRVEALGQEVKQAWLANFQAKLPKHFPDHLTNYLFHELTHSRLPALLRYEDRLSMAFSIESRVPLLDHRLIETAFALPDTAKVGPGWSKYLMRRALEGVLPQEVTWRKDKKGFPTPFEPWVQGELGGAVRELLNSGKGWLASILGAKPLAEFFAAWDQGRRDPWQLWRFLSLELWLGSYLERLRRELDRLAPQARPPRPAEVITRPLTPRPVEVVVTVDYETFDTNDLLLSSRWRIDWDKDLIQPTERLARVLEEHGARLTVLWDTAEYFWLLDHGYEDQAAAIREQLVDLVRRGHDVQLHLHPAWCSVRREGEHWLWERPGLTLPAMDREQLEELVARSVRTMEELFRPLRPDYRVRGFRGRSYEVEPFRAVGPVLAAHGIRADSSYHGQGPVYVRLPELQKAVPPAQADFLEYPIFAHQGQRWDFSGPPQFVDLPLRALGDKPPHGQTLVLIGHCKQPIHYQELGRVLGELKARYGEALRFVTWQESIERRLGELKGGWLPAGGFSQDYFEARWQEEDPFASARIDDPYYRRLLELAPRGVESLLDLGCAEGDFTAALARHTGAKRVLGVDISPSAVRRARRRHPEHEFVQADLIHLRRDERFDLILASQNLYYFTPAERARVLTNLEAMLAPEGRALLAWWTGARRGYQEEKIEEEIGRFFRPERAETYRAPEGCAVKGEHRILLVRRRLSPAEEALRDLYWRDMRVCCRGPREEDWRARFAWLAAQWNGTTPQEGWDLVLAPTPDEAPLEELRPCGTAVFYAQGPSPQQAEALGLILVRRVEGLCFCARREDAPARAKVTPLPRRKKKPAAPASPPAAAAERAPVRRVQTLVVVTHPAWLEHLPAIRDRLEAPVFTAVRRNLMAAVRETPGLETLDPRELGAEFFYLEPLGYMTKYHLSQDCWRHYDDFHRVFQPVMELEAVRRWRDYDLFQAGDYNLAYNLGQQVFHLIDLYLLLIEQTRPQRLVGLDFDAQQPTTESTVLRTLGTARRMSGQLLFLRDLSGNVQPQAAAVPA